MQGYDYIGTYRYNIHFKELRPSGQTDTLASAKNSVSTHQVRLHQKNARSSYEGNLDKSRLLLPAADAAGVSPLDSIPKELAGAPAGALFIMGGLPSVARWATLSRPAGAGLVFWLATTSKIRRAHLAYEPP